MYIVTKRGLFRWDRMTAASYLKGSGYPVFSQSGIVMILILLAILIGWKDQRTTNLFLPTTFPSSTTTAK